MSERLVAPLRHLLLRVPPMNPAIRRLTVQLTKHCNLNCNYCYCNPVTNGMVEGLALGPLLNFIADACLHGAQHVVLTGGEPLLYPDLDPLLIALVERQIGLA